MTDNQTFTVTIYCDNCRTTGDYQFPKGTRLYRETVTVRCATEHSPEEVALARRLIHRDSQKSRRVACRFCGCGDALSMLYRDGTGQESGQEAVLEAKGWPGWPMPGLARFLSFRQSTVRCDGTWINSSSEVPPNTAMVVIDLDDTDVLTPQDIAAMMTKYVASTIKETREAALVRSPCCGAAVNASLGDGKLIGSCDRCGTQIHPAVVVAPSLASRQPK